MTNKRNVSVRLDEYEYKQLLRLQDYLKETYKTKLSFSQILKKGLITLYLAEIKEVKEDIKDYIKDRPEQGIEVEIEEPNPDDKILNKRDLKKLSKEEEIEELIELEKQGKLSQAQKYKLDLLRKNRREQKQG